MQKVTEQKATNHLRVIHKNETLNLYDAIADLQILVKQLEQRIEVQSIKKENKILFISTSEGVQGIRLSDITYCAADGNYTRVFIQNRAPILTYKTLKSMTTEINDERFIRCHQSYLVNREHIKGYEKCNGAKLNMNQGHPIPISRRLKQKVLKWLNS